MRFIIAAFSLLFAPAAQAQTLSDLGWLKGCWRMERGEVSIVEVWSAPPAPVMYGYAVSYRNGAPVFWEDTRIEDRDGAIAFVAMPNGADAVRFAMTQSGPNSVVFENPAHDYPQRISYERAGESLTATTSAGHAADEFRYTRMDCPTVFAP